MNRLNKDRNTQDKQENENKKREKWIQNHENKTRPNKERKE